MTRTLAKHDGLYDFPSLRRGRLSGRHGPEQVRTPLASTIGVDVLPAIPGCLFLRPGDPEYERTLPTYNLRVAKAPQIRALCSTQGGVAGSVNWVRGQGMRFALRSGGHSFEGHSENPQLVLDIRQLASVRFDSVSGVLHAGAGATLGAIYAALPPGLAFSAGSCPGVGIAGHTLGGGIGLLSRSFGLACDNLKSLRIVDAQGQLLDVDDDNHANLFRACRGGGGGSFGVATAFAFKTHPVSSVTVFGINWTIVDTNTAVRLIDAWQRWAPATDRQIMALLKISKMANNKLRLRCFGQSLGPASSLQRELAQLIAIAAPDAPPQLKRLSFQDAVKHYAGAAQDNQLGKYYTKEKSDFAPILTRKALTIMVTEVAALAAARVLLILTPLGGALQDPPGNATAFPHRQANCLLHYISLWGASSTTAARLRDIRKVYAAMRPHLPGWAYVNYCDEDLPNWASAYWDRNLPRLKAVKRAYDPQDLFRFTQSIPLP